MPEIERCPTLDDLHRFLLGQVEDADAARVQDHLSACGICLDTVANLKTDDTLLAAVRAQARAAANPDAAVVERLMDRLSGLHRPAVEATSELPGPVSPLPGTQVDLEFLAPPVEPGELGRLGPYRVLNVLGAGGMGIVFEAEDPQLKRRVALKVVRPALAADAVYRQRFLREAQATAALEHDHVVNIHHVGEDRGVLFLAMQLLQGETLEERLKREVKLPAAEVLRIGREIAEGLAAAHAKGLIHRDVKPANVWLEGRRGRVKVLDFGLARPAADDAHLTQSGTVAGTPQYMAPEQARGEDVDPRSDLFSLGCVLYRLLTARLPFRGTNTMAVLSALALDQPQPPHEIRPESPRALSDLTMRLLAKEPGKRPQSAESVVNSLARIEQALTPPAVAKPFGRRSMIIAAAVALLLLGPLAAWYGPAVYRITTNQGQLVIQTDDPDVEVSVKRNGERVKIIDRKTGREVNLTAGRYELVLSKGKAGLRLSTTQFTLERGGEQIVKVWLEPAATAAIAPALPGSPGPLAAAPPSPSAAPASPAKPFVILAQGGRAEAQFGKLAAAIGAADSGDTIEIRGNGPFGTPKITIQGRRALVLRAGAGFEPVLQPAADSSEKNTYLLGTDGPLVLEGLHFQHVEDPGRTDGYYVFVRNLEAPLSVTHCRFFLKSNRNNAAINTEKATRVQVRHCEFAGACSMAISWGQPLTTFHQLEVTDNLCWGTNGFVIYHHYPSAVPREVALRMHRNTFVGVGAVSPYYSQLPEPPSGADLKAFSIDLRENILDAALVLGMTHNDAGKFQPDADQKLLPRLMAWNESKNLYTGALLRLVQYGGTPKVDFFKNVADWQTYWGLKDTGSLHGRLRYQGGNVRARKASAPDTLTAADFRLHTNSDGKAEGADGRDVGADVDQVGPGKAYEKWKNTPAYGTWLTSTGQVVDAEPFVLLAPGGRREFKFPNLVEAIDFARAGDTVEIRGNGPFVTGPVKITGKALTVRAGQGFAPVIQLDPAAIKTGAILLETDAALSVEGLELQRIGTDELPDGFSRKVLLSSRSPLRLAHCRFLMQGVVPSNYAVVAEQTPHCEVRNCFLGGGPLVAIYWTRPPGGEMIVENCLISAENYGLVVWQGGYDSGGVSVRLTHSTFLASCPLQYTFAERNTTRDPAAAPTLVEASDNVFDAGRFVNFLQYLGERSALGFKAGQARLRELVAWRDERNLYRVFVGYLSIQHNAPPPPQMEDGLKQLAEWHAFWEAQDTGSLEGRPLYQSDRLNAREIGWPQELRVEDFRLQAGSPGQGAGEDGRDLGADVSLVGPGPAYDYWRKTREYQEWLATTGDVKVTPPAAEPFVVMSAGGNPEFKFSNLAEAVTASRPGDVIEIRGNGPFVTEPVAIYNKALTVRAGQGCTPVLQLSPAAVKASTNLLFTNAPLVLEGLELQRLGPEDAPAAQVLLSSSEAPLHLAHCRLLLRTKPDGAPAVISQASQHFEARNCFIACNQTRLAVDWRPATGGRMVLEDCLISNQNGGVFVIPAGRDTTGVTVRLAGNTILANTPIGLYFDEKKIQAGTIPFGPIVVESSDNVFDASQLLVAGRILAQREPLEFKTGQAKLRERLAWRDQRNLYGVSQHYLALVHQAAPQPDEHAEGLKTLAEWHALWESKDTGSLEGWPRFKSARLNARDYTRPEELGTEEFRLQAGSPGQGAGEGGRDLGADVTQLGPGPAYDRWKQTPDYQQWLKDTGQLPR